MCGISGFFLRQPQQGTGTLVQMTRLLAHRGPDDEGYLLANPAENLTWQFAGHDSPTARQQDPGLIPSHVAAGFRLGIGFRRYAVQNKDLAGAQPFEMAGCRLAFNGELYNYRDLRATLSERQIFRTDTDIEVVLAAYLRWGTDCFARFRGPFAIVLYDAPKRELLIARDHFGKSPLYIAEQDGNIYWSSDIKPILAAVPEISRSFRAESVHDYIWQGIRDFGHHTFWSSIRTFPNGAWMRKNLITGHETQHFFWQLPKNSEYINPRDVTPQQCARYLREHFIEALNRRLPAVLPKALTLSGGMDSSAIAAAYVAGGHTEPLDCFTVRYKDRRHDESGYAQALTARFPGQLRQHLIDGDDTDILGRLDDFLYLAEEPIHDPVPIVELDKLAYMKSLGFGVFLSGAAGDEVLAGYNGMPYKPFIYQYLYKNDPLRLTLELPFALRSEPAAIGRSIWQKIIGRQKQSKPVRVNLPYFPEKTLGETLHARSINMLTDYKMNYWLRSLKFSWSLPMEPRLPFLDVDFVAFCMTIPPAYMIRQGYQKYLLRLAFAKELPDKVTWRAQKMGFPFDTAGWLQNNQPAIANSIMDIETPWISGRQVSDRYSILARQDASLLWRLVCLLRWYRLFSA